MTYAENYDPLSGAAIVGMAGRFPGAANIDEFWKNLRAGVESISFFTDSELEALRIDTAPRSTDPNYVKARGIIESAEQFDADFFGISPREAELMDPQQRIFLETAWQALEHAGYSPQEYTGLIGVFAGMSNNSYFPAVLSAARGDSLTVPLQTMMGNEKDYLATRVAYKLNLRGPSLNIQTACSTSLVAVCQAYQSLLTYQCDMALAGAVSIVCPQKRGYLFYEGAIVSPDGCCRPFDAAAQGTVFSNGVGIVVLKRLQEALADGDQIFAVIKGAALNNDGADRAGFAAPNINGQADVVAMAQALAGTDPETISYVEAHGTATALGDPIEIAGLTQAFRLGTTKNGFCALGSVKGNIGHLDVAAGIAGLIKTVLALEHKKLPPSLNFQKPNPKIDFANTPFFVNTTFNDWRACDTSLRAGVSSFGSGGTNAHVIVEEAPRSEPPGAARKPQILVLSAKSENALEKMTDNLAQHLRENRSLGLSEVAFTLQTGRQAFAHRRALVCEDIDSLIAALNSRSKPVRTRHEVNEQSKIAFMFPGQGAQYVNMGRGLYEEKSVFRTQLSECAEVLAPHLDLDIRTVLYPQKTQRETSATTLQQTAIAQPALFAVEYALAQQWIHWGIEPVATIGHSVGEYAAACVAGVITRDDALTLLAKRARLMQSLKPGAMLAVRLPAALVEQRIPPGLAIAAINSESLTVVSGSCAEVQALARQLSAEKIACRQLATAHAFHSSMLDPIITVYAEVAQRVQLARPQIPWMSTCTGAWMTEVQSTDPQYWVHQMRQPVQFAKALGALLSDRLCSLLEVGPGRTLVTFARQHPQRTPAQDVVTSLPRNDSEGDIESMLDGLGQLWLAGASVDWHGVHDRQRRCRVALPTYPFERKRFWTDGAECGSEIDQATPNVIHAGESPTAKLQMSECEEAAPMSGQQNPKQANQVLSQLAMLFSELSGIAANAFNSSVPFVELGLDSLVLTQASGAIHKKFGVKVRFRQLLEELSTLDRLAEYLAPHLVPVQTAPVLRKEGLVVSVPAREKQSAGGSATSVEDVQNVTGADTGALERIFSKQLEIMQQQLDMLKISPASSSGARVASASPAIESDIGYRAAQDIKPDRIFPASVAVEVRENSDRRGFGPYKPVNKGQAGELTEAQQRALDAFAERYVQRTKESKRLTAKHRSHFADPRTVSGFRLLWKEIVYPIVTERSRGSKLWDVDGNEYVDLTNGFGAVLFGHGPEFVKTALVTQLEQGIEIGPQSPLAGRTAELLCALTGKERAGFCNTGSEAVLAAFRIARTVTGRDKIAMFTGDYHGIFDEVVVRSVGNNQNPNSMPASPGIPSSATENIVVLDYGDPGSLEYLRRQASEFAAVIVEPVQSRRLDFQPKEFLQELRKLTAEAAVPLIFDEIVTGFRIGQRGAQGYFGIEADIATYGKVIGGGFPIGVIAGKANYMDALDGGQWNYGDDSAPEVGMTFFAGTFVRHPLALAAAWACLNHLKEQGPELQRSLNQRTEGLVETLRAYAQSKHVPVRITQFSSLFSIEFSPDLPCAPLFYAYMREHGIHLWDGRLAILTTAHSDADLDRVIEAFKTSIAEMQAAGFLPGPGHPGDDPSRLTEKHNANKSQYPITDAQRELWLAAQMGEDASRAFIDTVMLRLRGALNADAMVKAINDLVARHDALRSRFSEDGETAEIAENLLIDVSVIDLSAITDMDRDNKLNEIAARDNRNLFNLSLGPLFRFSVVKLADDDHALLFTSHHIVVDGWSHGVLLDELGILYSRHCGADLQLPDVAGQFAKYARWQQDQLKSSERKENENYWLARFETPAPVLELPTDKPRPAVRTYSGSLQTRVMPASLSSALRRFATDNGATLFTTLLASFNVLLHRLSGQDDLVVAISVAGQFSYAAPDLVGHCVNFLPLRSPVQSEQAFSDYLVGIRTLVLDAFEHQDYTYGGLLQKLKLPRDVSRAPLVSVSFNLDKVETKSGFHGLEVEIAVTPGSGVNFDSEINLVDTGSEITVQWQYNTDLFDAETIRRWLSHYETLLKGIVANSSCALSDLPLLNQSENHRLLVEWNFTNKNYGPERTLHQLFETQAGQTPDAIAVIFENQQLSYGELNRRANQLAHYLRKSGVGSDALVGVCMERSLEMVIGLMAVLKAGGAYVPLDPAYPPERLAFMFADAQPKILLTQADCRRKFPSYQGHVMCLDSEWEVVSQENRENPDCEVSLENLAFVIYTSGSTGKPKGAMNLHRGVCNRLLWMQETYQLLPGERVLQKTPFSFDVSVWEIFWPLITGARLVIARPDGHRDSTYLIKLINAQQITTLHFVPSMLRVFLEESNVESCRSLRRVICSGEALPFDLQQRFFSRLSAELHNLYGPTEASIDATYWQCQPNSDRAIVPIGRPIANTQIYLLDSHLQPVPIGIAGELHIGGVGLARGYHNRPELTAEKFIRDPFSGDPKAKLYKTGDLARYLPDGSIEYLGRIDFQVKIRGFRIELGEIESVLTQCPKIKGAVAKVFEEADDKQVVVYCVAKPEVTATELREYLKNKLPEFMIPSAYVFLDMLPLTPSGKVDRGALSAPDLGRRELATEFISPRNEIEETLERIWKDVLDLDRVGMRDHFFDLGGHSLLAVKVYARLREEFQIELPIVSLFQHPTIEELAVPIAEAQRRRYSPGARRDSRWKFLREFQAGKDKMPVYMIPGGIAGEVDVEMFFYARLAHYVGVEYPFYGLRPKGADGMEAPHKNVKEMANDYLAEIRKLQPRGGPYYLTGACIGGVLAYEMACQLENDGEEVAFLGLLDTDLPRISDYLRYCAQPLIERWEEATKRLAQNYLVERAAYHLRELKRRKWMEIPRYIVERGLSGLDDLRAHKLSTFTQSSDSLPLERGFTNSVSGSVNAFQRVYESALRRHRPRAYHGVLTLINADELVSRYGMTLGWENLVAGKILAHVLPGTHLTLFRQDVRMLGAKLRECLDYVQKPAVATASTRAGGTKSSDSKMTLTTAQTFPESQAVNLREVQNCRRNNMEPPAGVEPATY